MELNINDYIRNRRSIYPASYTDEKIDDHIIEEILENANWAPTHKMTQPWRFVVFTGKGLQTLGDEQARIYKEVTTRDGSFQQSKFENLRDKPLKASHVIAIIMKRDTRVPEIEEISSVAAAVQNMYLSASAYGLGSYWGTGGITYFKEASQLFSLEEGDRFMGFFFLGKTTSEWPKGRRDPISDKVQWIKE